MYFYIILSITQCNTTNCRKSNTCNTNIHLNHEQVATYMLYKKYLPLFHYSLCVRFQADTEASYGAETFVLSRITVTLSFSCLIPKSKPVFLCWITVTLTSRGSSPRIDNDHPWIVWSQRVRAWARYLIRKEIRFLLSHHCDL